MIRTTWLFRDGSWSKAEDKVDMRTLGNKTAKLDSPTIMSMIGTIVPLKPEAEALSP